MATTTVTRTPQRPTPSTVPVAPPPPPPPPKPPPTRRTGALGGGLSLGSLMKVRRRASEEGELVVGGGIGVVRGLVGAQAEQAVQTHPGLFPLYRRLQIALGVLLGLGLCPPERLVRIQATAMQARHEQGPDRMMKALTRALDTTMRTVRHGQQRALYDKHVQLYSDWWASAWFCGLRRVDVLEDLLQDMRHHLRPMQQPGRRPHLLGAMSYTFGPDDYPQDHPQTAYTVTGAGGSSSYGSVPLHATVHSSSPLELEWARSSPRAVPLRRTKQTPRLAPDVFVPPEPSPPSLPPSLPSPSNLPPGSPGPERSKEGRSVYDSVKVLGRFTMATILPGRRRKTSVSKEPIPETPPPDSGLLAVRGPGAGRQRSVSRESNNSQVEANALTVQPTGSRLAQRRPSLPF